MLASRNVRLGLIALAVLAALGLLLYPTDEKRVREAAEALIAAANESEVDLAAALEKHAVADVSVSISDYPEALQGRAALVRAAARARVGGQKLRFRMETVEISVEGSHARLNADLVASLQLGLREMKQARHGVALFQKLDGRFQLVSAEVGSERHDQPEARP
ncbi:MAG TPA: nuclear transport factor 2 family protein [Polyangiaceae bacterium]